MGWKSVKEAYDIDHIVKMEDGKLQIGSGYVGDLITVHPDASVTVNSIVTGNDGELSRIRRDLEADPARLQHLLNAKDRFDASLPVWTYEEGNLLELQCEEHGWPNVTHDGRLMYENTFFEKRDHAIRAAIKNGEYAVKGWTETVEYTEKELEEKRDHLERAKRNLENYRSLV